MSTVIDIQHLYKTYELGSSGKGTLREFVNGVTNRRSREYFDALHDINLSIGSGETVGLIGGNGAGKSTLLKVLSKITKPTSGRILLTGRVSSLLEVGTGFHPELTGRENIYLNGSILGMRRHEIRAKFDEIVAFSGVSQFLDTPVKHYSSGMYVRLAFSVAAHLEPDILIVDEVLAVGDAAFQQKCLGKMQEVSGAGRTVLFVSHNFSAVRQLCRRGIWINQGHVLFDGTTDECISHYSASFQRMGDSGGPGSEAHFSNLQYRNGDGKELYSFSNADEIHVSFDLWLEQAGANKVVFKLEDQDGRLVFTSHSTDLDHMPLHAGTNRLRLRIPPYLLNQGEYRVMLGVGIDSVRWLARDVVVSGFTVQFIPINASMMHDQRTSVVVPMLQWTNDPEPHSTDHRNASKS